MSLAAFVNILDTERYVWYPNRTLNFSELYYEP